MPLGKLGAFNVPCEPLATKPRFRYGRLRMRLDQMLRRSGRLVSSPMRDPRHTVSEWFLGREESSRHAQTG